ncbi:MAG: formylglycine-generating enzyme family protein, partial [Pseudomonadales bacterium]|nr:formylglycine-generating enzyme family protein [Pseudomonadales bacterium]
MKIYEFGGGSEVRFFLVLFILLITQFSFSEIVEGDEDDWTKEYCYEMLNDSDVEDYVIQLSVQQSNELLDLMPKTEFDIFFSNGVYIVQDDNILNKNVYEYENSERNYEEIIIKANAKGLIDESILPSDDWEESVYLIQVWSNLYDVDCDTYIPTYDDKFAWILYDLYYDLKFTITMMRMGEDNYSKNIILDTKRNFYINVMLSDNKKLGEVYKMNLVMLRNNKIQTFTGYHKDFSYLKKYMYKIIVLNSDKYQMTNEFKIKYLWHLFQYEINGGSILFSNSYALQILNDIKEIESDGKLWAQGRKELAIKYLELSEELLTNESIDFKYIQSKEIDKNATTETQWIELKANIAKTHLNLAFKETTVDGVIEHYKESIKLDKTATTIDQWEKVYNGIRSEVFTGKLILIKGEGISSVGFDSVDEIKNGNIEYYPRNKFKIDNYYINQTEVTIKQWNLCYEMGWCNRKVTLDNLYKQRIHPLRDQELDIKLWLKCIENGPCNEREKEIKNIDDLPIELFYNEIHNQFLPWLSTLTGIEYKLPTEMQWEHAARAGKETKYTWGDEVGYGNAYCAKCEISKDEAYKVDYLHGAIPVVSFESNVFGLYDVHGNVAELVRNCWEINKNEYIELLTGLIRADCNNAGV